MYSQSDVDIAQKYNIYRQRILNEWIIVSPNVEQFGTNIPALDRQINNDGKITWVSWSDGNANYNHWLGILATEYRLLKNNGQDYSETLKMLLYTMFSLERLDLYSEYNLRKYFGLEAEIKYPEDINGFMLRDDVTLGFWKQYHNHFNCEYGKIIGTKDGTNTYLSVFRKGKIPKQGMSQDNISYLLQSLALVKQLVDDENISNIKLIFENPYIPDYLKSKGIWVGDTVYFGNWVADIADRLLKHISHKYPERKITLKPTNNFRARPAKVKFGGLISSYWYIMNPVTNDLVAEGNGEDMGVWINSYGFAEAAKFITGKNIYHTDGSDRGLSKYIFKTFLFKNMRFLRFGGIPVSDDLDDYMTRALATVGDINWNENSYELFYLMNDKREKWTYEHNPLILYILHKEKYSKKYNPEIKLYNEDKSYFEKLLGFAPVSSPSSDTRREEYSKYWSTSSLLNWPNYKGAEKLSPVWEYAGLDYMFLYNLYRLVFEPENYTIDNNLTTKSTQKSNKNSLENYTVPDLKETDLQYFYMPPKKEK